MKRLPICVGVIGTGLAIGVAAKGVAITPDQRCSANAQSQACCEQPQEETILTPQQGELRQLRMGLEKSRNDALRVARAVIQRQIEAAKAEKPSGPRPPTVKPETVEAIRICALARDTESIPNLIELIYFRAPVEQMEGNRRNIGSIGSDPPVYKSFPACNALVLIGATATRPLVLALEHSISSEQDFSRQFQLAATLAAIAGPEGGMRLFDEAMANEPTLEGRKNLRRAQEFFGKQGRIPLFTEAPSYQLYKGTVDKDVSRLPRER